MNESTRSSPPSPTTQPRRSSLIRFLDPQDNYGSIGNGNGDVNDNNNTSNTNNNTNVNNGFSNFDGHISGDLSNIFEEEEMLAPLLAVNGGGSTDDTEDDTDDDDDDDDHDDDDSLSIDDAELEKRLSELSSESFHLGGTTTTACGKRVSIAANVMVQERRTSSFMAHGDEYELVPTKIKNNVRLVEDNNLDSGRGGRLYLASYSLYKNCHDMKYALTIKPDIYRNILREIDDAYTTPCGLYFCCHGGDGAHTGVSHDDYVDIKLAWFVLAFVFAVLLIVELTFPWPESYDDGVTDDIFS
jgi:hypothetical protein